VLEIKVFSKSVDCGSTFPSKKNLDFKTFHKT